MGNNHDYIDDMLEQYFKVLEGGTFGYSDLITPEKLLEFFKNNPFIKDQKILFFYRLNPYSKKPFILNPLCKENNFPEMSEKELLDFLTVSLRMLD